MHPYFFTAAHALKLTRAINTITVPILITVVSLATLLIFFRRGIHKNIIGVTSSSLLAVKSNKRNIQEIHRLADTHEVASALSSLIKKNGAGSWPPLANHDASGAWPAALQPYRDIYIEMAPLLPTENISTDDTINISRITAFRERSAYLLKQKVDVQEVMKLMSAADAGRWDIFPRDVYNAFYCCISWSRHAYRWTTIPVVRVAQLEKTLDLPPELVLPWKSMQNHFGIRSESGNLVSNILLDFDQSGKYTLQINTGLSNRVTSSEEEFGRIFYEMETLALPIYRAIVMSIISYARENRQSCLYQIQEITAQMRPLLSSFYHRLHDSRIGLSVWMRYVQGFYAWGLESAITSAEGQVEWEKSDGVSGNHVLFFQIIDAFLGLESHLPQSALETSVPALQRDFCKAVSKYSFRRLLGDEGIDGDIKAEFAEIVKQLRVFRSAHRSKAKAYFNVPAPERLPMSSGKSLLKGDMEQSLAELDEFMVRRLQQTV